MYNINNKGATTLQRKQYVLLDKKSKTVRRHIAIFLLHEEIDLEIYAIIQYTKSHQTAITTVFAKIPTIVIKKAASTSIRNKATTNIKLILL